MAKAKKPVSRSKGSSQAPNVADSKADAPASGAGDKGAAPQATQATTAKSVDAPTEAKAAVTPDVKSDGPAPAKTAEVKKAEKPETKASDVKPAAETVRTDTVKADATGAKSADKDRSSKHSAENSSPPPVAPSVKEPEESRSVFWPLVLGGVIAGGLGFVAAEMNFLNTRTGTEKLEASISQQQGQIEALENAPEQEVDLSGIEGQVAAVSETIAGVEAQLNDLDTRMAKVEARPIATGDGGVISSEYADGLDALKASVEQQRAEVEEQKAEIARLLENALGVEEATANAARAAAIQAASAKITAALGSGAGFSEAVDDLTAAGIEDLPAPLVDQAADGVATLSVLQTEFPVAARGALSAARAAGAGAGTGGVGGFLKRQLGARSVAPKDGDDPDAVLSRAEAAVRDGRIADALVEIDMLPPEAQEAMDAWLAQARTRADAETAVQDLSERLTAN